MLELNKIYNMDCLEGLKLIPDNSIDCIITDPPYATTNLEWDKIFNLNDWWNELKRISKENTPILIFSQQPFTTKLINSNLEMYKYELIWQKSKGQNIFNANNMPLKEHENIILFYNKPPLYNNIKYKISERFMDKRKKFNKSFSHFYKQESTRTEDTGERCQGTVLVFDSIWEKGMHPTQKPLDLIIHLIKMYSNENMLILDCFMGSGTTAVACKELGRNFIGFEISKEYCEIAEKRLKKVNNKKLKDFFSNN